MKYLIVLLLSGCGDLYDYSESNLRSVEMCKKVCLPYKAIAFQVKNGCICGIKE